MLLKLLGLPVTAPIAGFKFILQQLEDMAERELNDEDRLRDELLLLQLRLEEGEVSEDEYLAQEADIVARLRVIRERKLGITSGEPESANQRAQE
jgi:hypothetical protein